MLFAGTGRRSAEKMLACCLGLTLSAWCLRAAENGRITKAELGTDRTDKFEIVNPTTVFRPDTAQVVCVWKTEGVKPGTTVRAVWIAEDVGKVAPPNFKIAEASDAAAVSGSFYLTKPNNGFPIGKYRLEIYLGAELARTVPFTVAAR